MAIIGNNILFGFKDVAMVTSGDKLGTDDAMISLHFLQLNAPFDMTDCNFGSEYIDRTVPPVIVRFDERALKIAHSMLGRAISRLDDA